MSRIRLVSLAFGLAALAAPALAQGAPPFPRPPAPQSLAEAAPGAILVPPAVFGGAGYGFSGRGYYYDGPGEGPLLAEPASARSTPRRAR